MSDQIMEEPLGPLGPEVKIKPLNWRKPTDSGADFGLEDAVAVANGIGGKYSITKDSGSFLLWDSYDEFTFDNYPTLNEAKAAAEAHWQKSVRVFIQTESANAGL